MLGGSLAVWVRGGPESCNDLDLMIRREDADAALAALEGAGMRAGRPPEGWLYKAWDGDVLVDLIFGPKGLVIDDETFARSEPVSAFGLEVRAMDLNDVMTTKLGAPRALPRLRPAVADGEDRAGADRLAHGSPGDGRLSLRESLLHADRGARFGRRCIPGQDRGSRPDQTRRLTAQALQKIANAPRWPA